MHYARLFFIFLILCAFFIAESKDYGHIEFPTSLPPAQQKKFIQAVSLLHNFQYLEALQLFLQLEEEAPDFALGYWGEAMTYNHPLWDEQDFDAGVRALNKLAPTPKERVEKAPTPKAKGFIKAINALYAPNTEKSVRDRKYTEALLDLYKQFPDDNEVATFYALSLLGKEEGVRNIPEYMKAASVANDVMIRNPKHPGAMHYFIHSVDDPIHAPLGLNAARAYSKIVPDAPHAAHMPSHIYLALGMWKDVVDSNKLAWEAGEKESREMMPFIHHPIYNLHILQWLHFGYLELGEFDKANESLQIVYNLTKDNPNPYFKWFYFHMRASQAVATNQYDKLMPTFDLNGVELGAIGDEIYTRGLEQLAQKQDIQPLINQLSQIIEEQKAQFEKQTGPGANYYFAVHKEGIIGAQIAMLELTALNLKAQGRNAEAYQTIQKAIKTEELLTLGYGPPTPPKPAKEHLADFYLQDGQVQKACHTYQEVLLDLPNRRESLEKLQTIPANLRCPKRENLFYHRLENETE